MDSKADVVVVGGGLSGCLTALKLIATRPELHIILVDENESLAGHQTWCFHESDLPSSDTLRWLGPAIETRWDTWSVRFPKLEKNLTAGYFCLRSEKLDARVKEMLPNGVALKSKVVRLSESHVELADGRIIAARLVVDARGLESKDNAAATAVSGYQKFIGLEFELKNHHGMSGPVLVDATCPQLDGFRFYSLYPMTPSRVMVREVYYSDTPGLNSERIHRSLAAYVERQGWNVASVEREEEAVVPIPLTSEYVKTSIGGEALPIGMRAGFYNAFMGTSVPDALRTAEFLASLEDYSTAVARDGLTRFRRPWLMRQRFYRLLNRLVFYASEPSLRYLVFQFVFEQPTEVISRLLAGKSTWSDRLRLLAARPPVPMDRAMRSLKEKAIQSWASTRLGGAR